MAVTCKKLALADDVIANNLADSHSVLYSITDNTPAALTVGTSRIVGRASTGNIVALDKAGVLGIINVADGADVTGAANVASAGAVMFSTYSAKGVLLVGTGLGAATAMTVGGNDLVLTTDSTAGGGAWGMKWATPSSSGIPGTTFNAVGDLLIGTANDAYTVLSSPTLAADDFKVLRYRTAVTNRLEYAQIVDTTANSTQLGTVGTTTPALSFLGKLAQSSTDQSLWICTSL